MLMVSRSVTRLFIQKGIPLPPPSARSCAQPIRPARMLVRRGRGYLPASAIPSRQAFKEKRNHIFLELSRLTSVVAGWALTTVHWCSDRSKRNEHGEEDLASLFPQGLRERME